MTPSLNFTNVVTKTLKSSRSGLGQSNSRQSRGLSSPSLAGHPPCGRSLLSWECRVIPTRTEWKPVSNGKLADPKLQTWACWQTRPPSVSPFLVGTYCLPICHIPIPLLKSTLLVPNPSPQGFQKDSTQHKPKPTVRSYKELRIRPGEEKRVDNRYITYMDQNIIVNPLLCAVITW